MSIPTLGAINTSMFKCDKCDRVFDKLSSLGGHQRAHSEKTKLGADIQKTKERAKARYEKNVAGYLANPMHCAQCNNVIPYKLSILRKAEKFNKSGNIFCNRSCSASFNNTQRIRSASSNQKTSETLKQLYRSGTLNPKVPTYITVQCITCGKECTTTLTKKRKTCSKECVRQRHSTARQNRMNHAEFTSMSEQFTYKDETVRVESNLEKAGIIFIIEKFGASNLERFKGFIPYRDGDIERGYNPDFVCVIDGVTTIVEVKQPWSKNVDHHYNQTIPLKQEALKAYCEEHNYNMMWVDCVKDVDFKQIYKNVLASRNK